jgi:hypothetical protein
MVLKVFVWIILLIPANMVDCILLRSIVKQKYNDWITVGSLCVCNIVMEYVKGYVISNEEATYPMSIIFLILMIFILFEGKWYKKILAYVELMIALFIVEIVAVEIMFGILKYDESIILGFNWPRIGINFLSTVLTYIVVQMFLFVQKPYKYIKMAKEQGIVFVSIGMQVVLLALYCTIIRKYNQNMGILYIIYVITAIISDIMFIHTMGELELKQESEELLEKIQYRDGNVRSYYQKESAKLLNLTEFKDKYERKIKAIYDEIGVEYEGAKVNKEVLDEHHTDIDLEKDISNSGNSINTIVEKILKSKKMELDRLNCPYEINVDIDKQLNMDLMDISSLINNMLDNAIEAIKVYLSNDKDNEKRKKKKSGKTVKKTEIPRYIDVNAHVKDDIFVIEVKNVKSSHQETIELDGRYVSSKENKVGHGYGLYIIKRIAEKYNGKMEIDYTNKYFKNKVSIPCK